MSERSIQEGPAEASSPARRSAILDAPDRRVSSLRRGSPVGPARAGPSVLHRLPPYAGVGVVLLAMVVILASTKSAFFTRINITSLLRGSAVNLAMAIGTTVLITVGAIDLSIASMLAIGVMALAGVLNLGFPMIVAIFAAIAVCATAGALNGVLVAKAKLNFFVVTLGAMSAYSALASLPTTGRDIDLFTKSGFGELKELADGSVVGIPVSAIITVGLALTVAAALRWTTFGRALFATGGNPVAAAISGIPVDRVRVLAFTLNGALVGVAAAIYAGRTESASPSAAAGTELGVIAAVLLGGSSFLGGSSSIAGTVVGVFFIAVLQNGLDLWSVNVFWQGLITGAVLIAAVWLDQLRRNRVSR